MAVPEGSNEFDFVILGAGSAGCVLADRLTRNGRYSVLLVEAGPVDRNPLIDLPKGYGKLMFSDKFVWHYRAGPLGRRNDGEVWHRGKTLGGSSSINGMMYAHGQPEDYNDWAANGVPGWGWDTVGEAYRQMEDHELGASPYRGSGGPLHVGVQQTPDDVHEIVIAAAHKLGWSREEDMNEPVTGLGAIGYMPRTIKRGRRVSASRAFLDPARTRPNLHVVTDTVADRIVIEHGQATSVACRGPQGPMNYRARREIIVSLGAIQSPKLLQLSGIGPAQHLRGVGVEVVRDLPGVGSNMREHRLAVLQYRLRRNIGQNRQLRGVGLLGSLLRYAVSRTGPLALPSHQGGAFINSKGVAERHDTMLIFGPYSAAITGKGVEIEKEPGMRIMGHQLRPESQGTVMIQSADPDAPPAVEPNFLTSPVDQEIAVAMVARMRELAAQDVLAREIVAELEPTRSKVAPQDIIDNVREYGLSGHHATSTCKMGTDDRAVVDLRLRVHAIGGLRIMDCSVMPTLVSGNTNGPVMAMAWHAADLILEDSAG